MGLNKKTLALLLASMGSGGAPVEPPTGILRYVAVNNAGLNSQAAGPAGCDTCIMVWPKMIGSGDVSEIVLSNSAWIISNTGYTANPATIPIAAMSLENEARTISVPVTYGGLRPKTLAVLDNDIQADPVLPAAFGLSKFAVGSVVNIRIQLTVTPGQTLPRADSQVKSGLPNAQIIWLNSATTTITNGVDGVGPMTTSGGTLGAEQFIGYCPVMLGKFVSGDPRVALGVGDSVLNNVGDASNTPWGKGLFHRAMYADGTPSRVMAGMNFGRPSGSVTPWRTQAMVYGWRAYANMAVEEYGLNDFGTNGDGIVAATWKIQMAQVWGNLKGNANGVQKILRTKLLGRLASSDTFLTEANQTANGVWDTVCADINPWFDTQVGTYLAGTINMTAMRGVNPLRWKVDGVTPYYATGDGVHPSAVIHAALATEIRAAIDAA